MKFCTECGQSMKDKSTYCPRCGKNFPSLPEEDSEMIKTWLIPPQGCPVADHKFLDRQIVLANEYFKIPQGVFTNVRADGPRLFGVPELDNNCTCFRITSVCKKGTTSERAQSREKIII